MHTEIIGIACLAIIIVNFGKPADLLKRYLYGNEYHKWKKDKNDNVIEEPVKANDDLMDACRYAVFTHLTKLKFEVSVF